MRWGSSLVLLLLLASSTHQATLHESVELDSECRAWNLHPDYGFINYNLAHNKNPGVPIGTDYSASMTSASGTTEYLFECMNKCDTTPFCVGIQTTVSSTNDDTANSCVLMSDYGDMQTMSNTNTWRNTHNATLKCPAHHPSKRTIGCCRFWVFNEARGIFPYSTSSAASPAACMQNCYDAPKCRAVTYAYHASIQNCLFFDNSKKLYLEGSVTEYRSDNSTSQRYEHFVIANEYCRQADPTKCGFRISSGYTSTSYDSITDHGCTTDCTTYHGTWDFCLNSSPKCHGFGWNSATNTLLGLVTKTDVETSKTSAASTTYYHELECKCGSEVEECTPPLLNFTAADIADAKACTMWEVCYQCKSGRPNYQSQRGMFTLTECLHGCKESNTVAGTCCKVEFDFATNPWRGQSCAFWDQDNLKTGAVCTFQGSAHEVNTYRIDFTATCPPPGTTTKGHTSGDFTFDMICYTGYAGIRDTGQKLLTPSGLVTISTLDECRDACIADEACWAFDYTASPIVANEKCLLYGMIDAAYFVLLAGTDHCILTTPS